VEEYMTRMGKNCIFSLNALFSLFQYNKKMTWYKKVLKKYIKEIFSSATTYIFTVLFLTIWYFYSGEIFQWIWIEPLDVPPLQRALYSALTFITLGRIIYLTRFYKVLWEILGDWQSYKEIKSVIWIILIFVMFNWIIPAFVAVVNWFISIGYNIFKLFLYIVPSFAISTLVVATIFYMRNKYKI